VTFRSLKWLLQNTATEPPSKFVSHDVDVRLACRLHFVDMEGLNDGRALKTIVPQVNPRKMVCPHLDSALVQILTFFVAPLIRS